MIKFDSSDRKRNQPAMQLYLQVQISLPPDRFNYVDSKFKLEQPRNGNMHHSNYPNDQNLINLGFVAT